MLGNAAMTCLHPSPKITKGKAQLGLAGLQEARPRGEGANGNILGEDIAVHLDTVTQFPNLGRS